MNDTFRKWCESKEDVPVGVTSMYEHFFSTRSVWGLKLENWEINQPSWFISVLIYAPRHAIFEDEKPSEKAEEKEPAKEEKAAQNCVGNELKYDLFLHDCDKYIISEMNTLLSRLRFHILLQKEVGSIRHGWVSSFAHVFSSPRLLCERGITGATPDPIKNPGSKLHQE